LIRAALLTIAPVSLDRTATVVAFRQWVGLVAAVSNLQPPDGTVDAEVQRFLGRRPQPIKPASIARLCGVSSSDAVRLGLQVVFPVKRLVGPPNEIKRAKRMSAGIIPRVIDVEACKPWQLARLSRAKWFATNDAITRQVLAFEGLLHSESQEAVGHAKASISEARRIRDLCSVKSDLPVDQLLRGLDIAQKRHNEQLTWTPKYFIIQPRQGSKSKALVDLIAQLGPAVSLHGSVNIRSDLRDWPSAAGVNGNDGIVRRCVEIPSVVQEEDWDPTTPF
jgi:hypothetical protein